MSAVPVPQQTRRSADSWETFAQALTDESAALSRLGSAALALTNVLISGNAEAIASAERALDEARRAFGRASSARGMQVRGFGTMTLRQVCAYAPRRMSGTLNQRLAELSAFSTGIRITNANNKALILAGLDRLMKVTGALQRAASDSPGTYKRRGFVPPPRNSVIVSSRV